MINWDNCIGYTMVMDRKQALRIGTILSRTLALGALVCGGSVLPVSPAHAAPDSTALPSGGQVVGGSADLDYSAPGELHIHQSTTRTVINWESFDIGRDALTQFHQTGRDAVAVNRVMGGAAPTQILGALKANGNVMVLDRNGVFFGPDSRIDVGGIVASSGDIDPAAFMAGGTIGITDIAPDSAVINHGQITVAEAGLAAFVAPTVANHGLISAKLGRVQMAAGTRATLDLYGDGLVEVAVDDPQMAQNLTNTGAIHAEGGSVQITAAAARDVVDSVINMEGVINASSVTREGGKIVLTADHITLAEGSVLDADGGTDGGEIIVYADKTTYVAGHLSARGGSGGGGFIETSATDRVQIADSASIDTGGGTWLIDPTDFTIAGSGGDITPATLAGQLANNNITIETADAGGDAGDIFVEDDLDWGGDNTLSLLAHRNIEVNAAITNDSGGSLHLRADKEGAGTAAADGTVIFGAGGSITLSGGGRADLYYNPDLYNAPTDYSGDITGDYTAWMLVNTVDRLQDMQDNLSGSYALGTDIDAAATAGWNGGLGFDPIGESGGAFTGAFDGQDHTISNLTINRPATNDIGLFGRTNASTITNVGVTSVDITGGNQVGGLVGHIRNGSTITGSYATGDVDGGTFVGGLVGLNTDSSISDSYATGSVDGSSQVGGLVGLNQNSSNITGSYATGAVNGGGDYVGGLVGYTLNGSSITGSYAAGDVDGSGNYVGGLAGLNQNSSSISDSYATGDVDGSGNEVGGLVGLNQNSSSIADSYATGNVDGSGNEAGGLVGYNFTNSSVTGSYATGSVTGSGDRVGGLVGYNHDNSSIDDSYATGNVDGSGNEVGGLVGYNHDNSSIDDSYATGNVSGNNNVGAFAGRNALSSTITNSYSTGHADGNDSVGGFAGLNTSSSSVTNSYSTGIVTGNANVGGLIGSSPGGTATNSYWNTQTSGQATSDGGTGLTSAQMMEMASFAGWDISDEGGAGTVWRIYEGMAVPILRSFLDPLTVRFKDKSAFAGLDFDLPELSISGLVAGKGLDILLGTVSLSGADLATPGTYSILPTGLYSPQQGYDITFAPGTLTLRPQTFNNITDPGRTQVKITYDFEAGHASMLDPAPEVLWEIREGEWMEQGLEAERLTLPPEQEE